MICIGKTMCWNAIASGFRVFFRDRFTGVTVKLLPITLLESVFIDCIRCGLFLFTGYAFGDVVNYCPGVFPCLVLRASSVETLHHRTCGIRKRSRRLQHPLHGVLGVVANCPSVFPCPVLRASSVGTLHHRTCGIRKRSRGGLQHPNCAYFETLLWIAPAFSLSGLACFLSGDLAPQDLWNSKKIEKATMLSPNIFYY
jgi:hypothetical protein